MDNLELKTSQTKEELIHENCVMIDQLSTASDVADDHKGRIAELERERDELKARCEYLENAMLEFNLEDAIDIQLRQLCLNPPK